MFQYDDLFYGYSLIKAPEMDMSIVVFVNNWEIPWFTRFANWLMNKVWLHKNVLPNTRSRWTKNKVSLCTEKHILFCCVAGDGALPVGSGASSRSDLCVASSSAFFKRFRSCGCRNAF